MDGLRITPSGRYGGTKCYCGKSLIDHTLDSNRRGIRYEQREPCFVSNRKNRVIELVYVAGPLSNGGKLSQEEILENVEIALDYAEKIWNMGFQVYLPHLTQHWENRFHHEYDGWIDMALFFLSLSDAMFRIPGESIGTRKEVDFAGKHGIPVFYDLVELEVYRNRPLLYRIINNQVEVETKTSTLPEKILDKHGL